MRRIAGIFRVAFTEGHTRNVSDPNFANMHPRRCLEAGSSREIVVLMLGHYQTDMTACQNCGPFLGCPVCKGL